MSDIVTIIATQVQQNVEITVAPEGNAVQLNVTEEVEQVEINISQIGMKGDKGDPGEMPELTHTHTQSFPQTVWSGTHPLGRKITAVHVTDTGGNQWECPFDSTETTFSITVGLAAFAGTAILI